MAGIIKAGRSTSAPGRGPSPLFNFEDMTEQAETYLDAVRQQAEQIIRQAQEEADRIREQAREQGRQAALEAAQQTLHSQVENRLRTVFPALDQAVEHLNSARQEWQGIWHARAVRLATQIAERIVRRELQQQPEISESWIREALQLANGTGPLTLRLHPQDHNCLAPHADEFRNRIGNLAPTQIVADPDVAPGGCVVQSEHGQVDMQLETQLERLREELSGD